MNVRMTIRFTGTVQGVGFRYTTQTIAARHAIGGWVRNEPDKSVTCVAEGDEEELKRFVQSVTQAMAGYIQKTHVATSPATGEFDGRFSIRR